MSLYHTTIPQLLKFLNNLEGWVNKAETFCAANDIEPSVLLEARLYPNMYPLRQQIGRACSNAALLADRLGTTPRPDASDDATSFEEVRQTIATTKTFIAGVDAATVDAAEDRMVDIPGIDGMRIRGEDLATDFSLPNVYFHLTTAYGIMRHAGVPVGKADFLGPMTLVPAG